MSVPVLHSIANLIEDLHLLRAAPSDDVQAMDDRAAAGYDRFRELWRAGAGRAAERARLDDVGAGRTPGKRRRAGGVGATTPRRSGDWVAPVGPWNEVHATGRATKESASTAGNLP